MCLLQISKKINCFLHLLGCHANLSDVEPLKPPLHRRSYLHTHFAEQKSNSEAVNLSKIIHLMQVTDDALQSFSPPSLLLMLFMLLTCYKSYLLAKVQFQLVKFLIHPGVPILLQHCFCQCNIYSSGFFSSSSEAIKVASFILALEYF